MMLSTLSTLGGSFSLCITGSFMSEAMFSLKIFNFMANPQRTDTRKQEEPDILCTRLLGWLTPIRAVRALRVIGSRQLCFPKAFCASHKNFCVRTWKTREAQASFETCASLDWQQPTLARQRGRTTIGGWELNERVRDGNVCFLSPMITRVSS